MWGILSVFFISKGMGSSVVVVDVVVAGEVEELGEVFTDELSKLVGAVLEEPSIEFWVVGSVNTSFAAVVGKVLGDDD